MKIVTGLRRAHRDCHDTRYELLELWINEVHYTYFEKLMPSKEKDELHQKTSDVMRYYFGQEAVDLLNDSHETLIGDFLDPYEFYTTLEVGELKEYVISKTNEIKAKYEGRGNTNLFKYPNFFIQSNTKTVSYSLLLIYLCFIL